MKRIKFFIVFISISSVLGCSSKGKFEIKNAGKDTVITILSKTTPTNFKLFIEGDVDDSFMINNTILQGGKVNDTLTIDWYSKHVIISYKAYKVKKGMLSIRYYVPGTFN